jgi:hypothetical protein
MKSSKILTSLTILQILAQAVFAQEPEAVPQEAQQAVQYVPQEPQQEVQQVQQMEQVPQQMAQQEAAAQPSEPGIPQHTITVDFGPTIIGFTIGALPTGNDDAELSGFGFGAQYEYQIFERLSVAGRLAYLSSGITYTEEENGDKAKATLDLSALSFEVHPRVYPFGGSFFLDAMIGYADLSLDIKGDLYTETEVPNPNYDPNFPWSGDPYITQKNKENKKVSVSRPYFKKGIKFGWRADFGEPGGFIFEHSYGWYSASGSGKTIAKRLDSKFDGEMPSDIDDMFKYLGDYIFCGGPRMTIAFGWKF